MSADPAPLIVTALFGPEDFGWLDGLRQQHFPPARNQLPAHLTLFHHLPPSVEVELRQRLGEAARSPRPRAEAAGLMNLGGGVAIRVASAELVAIRAELAEAFAGVLTPQDAAGWRPHVTIQNKVPAAQARALHDDMARDFAARPLRIEGLGLWRYRGGPWEVVSRHQFRG